MWYFIDAVVFLFVGGYGGYAYGRSVEAKAQAALESLRNAADAAKKAL